MQQFFSHRIMSLALTVSVCTNFTDARAVSKLRYIFGSEPVSQDIQHISNQADEITNFETPTLKMNWLAKKLGYSSFNWFNTTWIDEEALKNNPKLNTLWQLIHEKHHTLWAHDLRRLIGAGTVIATTTVTALVIAVGYGAKNIPMTYKIIYGLDAMATACLATFLFLWHEEYCERQADVYADRMLKDVV